MAGRLDGKVAIVTGAGRGVGRAIAHGMAAEGARIVVADNGSAIDGSGTSSEPTHAVVAEIQAAGGEAVGSVTDVSSWSESEQLIELPITTWGKLDILVNCAGNLVRDSIADVTPESLAAARRVHMDGMLNTSHFAARHWIERAEYGRLINFTSDSAMSGVPDTLSYGLAKGAVIALTRAVANTLVAYNVTANALTQVTRTRMRAAYHGGPEEAVGPEESPETVAPLVIYLASPEAANVTGRIFGSYGFRHVRWSEPVHEAVLTTDGPWRIDDFFERFGSTLGEGLDPAADLRYPARRFTSVAELAQSSAPSPPPGSTSA